MSSVVNLATAKGMLTALRTTHSCTNMRCKKAVIRGDGSEVILRCPYENLDRDLHSPLPATSNTARRTIQTMYASEAKAAMGHD